MNRALEPEMRRDYRTLALLAPLLAVCVVFLHTPIQIYAANASEFASPVSEILKSVVIHLGALAVVLALPAFIPRRAFRRAWAAMWFAIAITAWVSSNFVVLDVGSLAGRANSIELSGSFALTSMVLLTAVAAGAVGLTIRLPRVAANLAAALGILLVGATVHVVARDTKQIPQQDAAVKELFRFSESRNVLVVLLDSFQADLLEDILASKPALERELDGFTVHPDTVAPASTTYVSMPVIHSGRPYDPGRPLSNAYAEQVSRGSFLVGLKKAGYETLVLDPIQGICPDGAVCSSPATVLKGRQVTAAHEYLRLLDLALFRAAPAHLKHAVFNGGAFRVRNLVEARGGDNKAYETRLLLESMAERVEVRSGKPAAKFLHLYSSHPPVELNADCEPVPRPLEFSRAAMVAQSRCGLEMLSSLLTALKSKGIYDRSVIVVLADHGLGIESAYVKDGGRSNPGWRQRVGMANALLMHKGVGSHGPLKRSFEPLHSGDLGRIVCSLTRDCGDAVATSPTAGHRLYHEYFWKHEYWAAEHIPGLKTFAIDGPLWSLGSWRRLRRPLLRTSHTARFTTGADAATFLDWGWSEIENWGVWSLGHESELSFSVEPRFHGRPMRFSAEVRTVVYPNRPQQTIRVQANGTEVGVWSFTAERPAGSFAVTLPSTIWPADDHGVTIRFRIDQPISPAEAGISIDARPLGIGLEAMSVQPI